MFEKVNPQHPDKLADRIAGAVVDLAYAVERNPRIAVEVLIGHGKAYVIIETSLGRGELAAADVVHAVRRICPYIDESNIHVTIASQDPHLADNQRDGLRSGDNGIFRGAPVTMEQRILTSLAATIHANFPTDGKYIIATHPAENPEGTTLRHAIICQSNATNAELRECLEQWTAHGHDNCPGSNIYTDINPLGPWTGGTDADSGATEDEKPDLLPSERVRDGMVEDLRRLCTDFTLYGPRKIDKTGISAFVAQEHFLLEDPNSESYCCANSEAQSKLLFRRIKHGLLQLNFDKRWRITEKTIDWTKKYQVDGHTSSITPLSAGSTTKDGLFAPLTSRPECVGDAGYTNGKSDMKRLVDVVESSMGPRREPLTVTTTTAGRITSGPFIEKLDSLHRLLEREMDWDTGEAPHLSYDRSLCILLDPDEWERQTEETLLTSKAVRRKINPMLGKIVQYQFYDDAVAKARMDGDLGEVISKLFNVYESGRLTQWIKSDRIRPLQVARSITDCKFADGWQVFVGLDFSHGDDLFAITYMGVNYTPSPTMAGKFFADMDAWVLEKTMQESPNRPLYEQWVEQGWLHVCPGEVFDSTYAINRLAEVVQQGINIIMFGFDPAQNAQPINQLKAWLQTLFQNRPDIGPKDMAAIIQQMVVPVPQTAMTQNPRIGELEHMILEQEPWLNFSQNPMWPWEFGNTAAMVNTSDLRRLVKGGPAPSHKMDNVAALVDALYCFDLSENRVVE